jgi:hypothetical protein
MHVGTVDMHIRVIRGKFGTRWVLHTFPPCSGNCRHACRNCRHAVETVDMLSALSTCCRDWRQAHQSNVLHSGGSPHISAVLWELSTCMSELSTCCRNCRHAVGTVDMLVGTVDMHVGTVVRHIKVMCCTTGGSPHIAAVLWCCRHAFRN